MTDTPSLRNIIDLVNEMAVPSEAMRNSVFYHGTNHDDRGKSILENGLKPGNVGSNARGLLTPTVGRTYMTANLEYAVIYCIGGNMLGCSDESAKYLIGKSGQFGWLFSIDGQTLEADVQPDEDSVGEAVMFVSHIMTGKGYSHGSSFENGLKSASRYELDTFLNFARHNMTPKQFRDAVDGLISAQASGGKRMLKKMSEHMKLWLINCGAHVAYQGPIVPAHAWRFDKTLTPKLHKDGSNFFELAQQIR